MRLHRRRRGCFGDGFSRFDFGGRIDCRLVLLISSRSTMVLVPSGLRAGQDHGCSDHKAKKPVTSCPMHAQWRSYTHHQSSGSHGCLGLLHSGLPYLRLRALFGFREVPRFGVWLFRVMTGPRLSFSSTGGNSYHQHGWVRAV